ncbi:magnesium chelatase [candidate division KSB1 bacterium]|nr:magnesium chelatase [candidate division KSB1 bacterium]NIR73005.1 magnesium chelatase [candidate division KSB1 bacterium]NIS28279.1 magnesium chelatase [candidate division KSB1 bacterium]NIT75151.1 magnesium chelatase [candidate division KSB1 bacterium]NIU28958.1 magnesium chelatase [candidate division KSB1 bacterium]
MNKSTTIAELTRSDYKILSVKQEMRKNLIEKLKNNGKLFPGIIGYDETVVPALCNAILSYHDIILLGLRGQAKTRILRSLPALLDETIPIIKGCEINDNPFKPVCKACNDKVKEAGDEVEIEWIHREERYGEKLATPDVTIADLIGDIDPIKAAAQKLHYAHEGVIHFGIIPRTNRGIFAINELPDLQPRIQVGLFNIMQEKDIQIRGFPVRIPLDVVIVYSANPEDYTNRGNIITPLKDRIGSQIMTHYPRSLDDGIQIASQEAWEKRDSGREIHVPFFFREIIEQVAMEARKSEFVDQKSGVSVRMTVTSLENLISNAERRTIRHKENGVVPRICDLYATLPSIVGKIELVYEGEQEGETNVAKALIGKAVKTIFQKYFPEPYKAMKKGDRVYADVVNWFKNNNAVNIADDMRTDEYLKELSKIKGLNQIVTRFMKVDDSRPAELGAAMEFVLDGLHQNSMLSKDIIDNQTSYKDMLSTMMSSFQSDDDDDVSGPEDMF